MSADRAHDLEPANRRWTRGGAQRLRLAVVTDIRRRTPPRNPKLGPRHPPAVRPSYRHAIRWLQYGAEHHYQSRLRPSGPGRTVWSGVYSDAHARRATAAAARPGCVNGEIRTPPRSRVPARIDEISESRSQTHLDVPQSSRAGNPRARRQCAPEEFVRAIGQNAPTASLGSGCGTP
jgi:hypothetical protein